MRNVCCNVLTANNWDSANGQAIDANQLVSGSFMAYFGDSAATGTFKMQASNDPTKAGNLPNLFVPQNWVDIPNATAAVSAGESEIISLASMSYRWVRAVWTSTAVAAELEVQDLTYTAVQAGVFGNSITITYLDPGGNDEALDVSVVGTDIVVSLATGGAGAITSTANDILAAIEASAEASELVTVAVTGTGTDVQTAAAEAPLADGTGGSTTINVNMNALGV